MSMTVTTCPSCATTLATEGLGPGTTIICASCLTPFLPAMAWPVPLRPRPVDDDAAESSVARAILPIGRSGWAIAAGYLGLFAVLPIFCLIALGVGIWAMRDLRRHPHKGGRGRAIFAIIMG